jgi:hypothetical protein
MILLAALATMCVLAADINGQWKARMPTRGGETRGVTFTFKVEGDKLTGTIVDQRGSTNISDGKVSGDTITFSYESPRGKRTVTGTVTGNEIKLKREGGQGPQEFVAKRATS